MTFLRTKAFILILSQITISFSYLFIPTSLPFTTLRIILYLFSTFAADTCCSLYPSSRAVNSDSDKLCQPIQLPVGLRPQPQVPVFILSTDGVIFSFFPKIVSQLASTDAIGTSDLRALLPLLMLALFWSGMRESNSRHLLGRKTFYH